MSLVRILSRLIVVLAATMALATTASAFGTINGLGQSAEHEKITRLGVRSFKLGPRTLDDLAGKRGTFGAVGAPDNPLRGLLTTAKAHCDGGDTLAIPGYRQDAATARAHLEACRSWMFRYLGRAVRAAGRLLDGDGRIRSSQIPTFVSCTFNGKSGRAKCDVLEALGLALHASQDFYAHTNWTDRAVAGAPNVDNPPGLGHAEPAAFINPAQRGAFPAGLISGCFAGLPERAFCRGRVRHAVLNKDNGMIHPGNGTIGQGKTTRGKVDGNFKRAVRAAIADTRAKWRFFEARVMAKYGRRKGRTIVCAIRRDDPSGCP